MFKKTLAPVIDKLKSIDQTIEIALAKQDMIFKEIAAVSRILRDINDLIKEQRDIAKEQQSQALIEKITPAFKPNDNRY